MASGIPVVSPRIGGPIELIEENLTGMLYEPGNGFDLRRKVLNLMSNKEVTRQMGDLGFKKVSQNTWENVCAQLENHYESIINLKESSQAS